MQLAEGKPSSTWTDSLYAFNNGTSGQALGAVQGGFISTGTIAPRYGALLYNGTGHTLTQFTLAYTGEQWWTSHTRAATLNFSYAVGAHGASKLGSTGYTTVSSLGPQTTCQQRRFFGRLEGDWQSRLANQHAVSGSHDHGLQLACRTDPHVSSGTRASWCSQVNGAGN